MQKEVKNGFMKFGLQNKMEEVTINRWGRPLAGSGLGRLVRCGVLFPFGKFQMSVRCRFLSEELESCYENVSQAQWELTILP